MPWQLSSADLEHLACGAAVLGTGGGGDPYLGMLLVARALDEHGPVTVVGPDELDDDGLVVPTAGMGAPTVEVEKIPSGAEATVALRALERHLGRAAVATMPAECGGANAMVPLLVGAQTGLPVVDADGMGRAFPELHMVTFGVHGLAGSPMAIADERGGVAIVDTGGDNRRLEWLARGLTVQMGGSAMVAAYPMSVADVRRTAVRGTLSLSLRIGRAIRSAQSANRDPFADLAEALTGTVYRHGESVFGGKVVDVDRRTTAGFVRGRARISAFGGSAAECELTFQNEHLMARIDGRAAAVVPDLIVVLDADSGEPITTEQLRYGQRVRIFVISAPDVLRTPGALALFGHRAFGLDVDEADLRRDAR